MNASSSQSNPFQPAINSPDRKRRLPLGSLALGVVIGVVLTALVAWQAMPSLMISVHPSRYDDVDQTCAALVKAIEANGWSSPAVRNMNQSMAKHGVQYDRPIRIVELCRAEYARRVLETNPEVSTLMPCAWGVYEGEDGKVYIAGMNMGLMGKMFGGRIAEVMGGHVAADEWAMLGEVIAD